MDNLGESRISPVVLDAPGFGELRHFAAQRPLPSANFQAHAGEPRLHIAAHEINAASPVNVGDIAQVERDTFRSEHQLTALGKRSRARC
jgi:hypothetical protein